jgi:hypothetical protein
LNRRRDELIARGQRHEDYAEHELGPLDGVGGRIARRGVIRVGDDIGDPADHHEREHPPSRKTGPFTRARRENSIRITAMIGTG